MSDELDELGEGHHGAQDKISPVLLLALPIIGPKVEKQPQCKVADKCWRRQCGKLNSIGTPWLVPIASISAVGWLKRQSVILTSKRDVQSQDL